MNNLAGSNPSDDNSSSAEFDELIKLGRIGDINAVGQLLSKYRNYLLLIANQNLDEALRAKLGASDAVQQSMISAQQNFGQFRGESEQEFLGWLKTILVNDMRTSRRQYSTRKRDAGLEVNPASRRDVVDPLLTPSSDAMQRERATILAEALTELSADYRQVIELRNFQQQDFAEIGEKMNRSADAARKLWARAVETLQAKLSAQSPELFSGVFTGLKDE